MKKLILVLMLGFVSIGAFAQVEWLTAYGVSIRVNGEWSEWEDCNIPIRIDFDNDVITIKTNPPQIYLIVKEVTPPIDGLGEQVAFKVIDQDRDTGRLRIRRTYSGVTQIYIDFSNVSIAYLVN